MMLARPGLPDFEYIRPESPQEVFDLLQGKNEDLKLLLGGTDLFIQMRDRNEGPGTLVDLKGLPGMQDVHFEVKSGLSLGAGVTLNQISHNEIIQENYPILCQAADTVGNYQLRNRATLGGNICNASPSADTAPAVLVYEGELILESARGERRLTASKFWLGPGQTALEADEYLKAIHFPPPPDNARGTYLKLGRNKMGDLAVVGVAVLGFPDDGVPAGVSFKIAINSTAPVPYRLPTSEEFLSEQPVTEAILNQAAEEAMQVSAPIEDVRATAHYQKKMVRNLTLNALKAVWAELQ
jgi:carbon-monoxide dehydrogenase medium subunit